MTGLVWESGVEINDGRIIVVELSGVGPAPIVLAVIQPVDIVLQMLLPPFHSVARVDNVVDLIFFLVFLCLVAIFRPLLQVAHFVVAGIGRQLNLTTCVRHSAY
jgi:hypothetical protein